MNITDILQLFRVELKRAESKFPTWPTDIIHAAGVVQEEAGELGQAALQVTYDGETIGRAHDEAVQVGAMALRFLLNEQSYVCRPSQQVKRDTFAGDGGEKGAMVPCPSHHFGWCQESCPFNARCGKQPCMMLKQHQ